MVSFKNGLLMACLMIYQSFFKMLSYAMCDFIVSTFSLPAARSASPRPFAVATGARREKANAFSISVSPALTTFEYKRVIAPLP